MTSGKIEMEPNSRRREILGGWDVPENLNCRQIPPPRDFENRGPTYMCDEYTAIIQKTVPAPPRAYRLRRTT